MEERRKTKRMKGRIRVAYGKSEVCVSDLTEDLSPQGVFVHTPYPLDLGSQLQIEIQWEVGKKSSKLLLQGKVARVVTDGEHPGMGLVFTQLTDAEKTELESLIRKLPGK